MSKIKSFDELRELSSNLKPNLSIRDNVVKENQKRELLVCGDTGCRAANSMPIIDNLNEELRLTIILYYFEDLKISEIANMLNIPQGTVKSRLSRAKGKIAYFLEEKEVL